MTNAPKGNFLVVAQLTENSPHSGATDKGYRYFVREGFDKRTEHIGDMGRGMFCQTIEQARNRIKADKCLSGCRTDITGLIDWGKSPAREYAIFPVSFGDAVE